MRKIALTAAIVFLGSTALTFGQNRQAATAVIPSITFEILDQSDSPLQISVDERMAARIPGAALKITNNSSSAVSAYVLHIKAGRFEQSHMVFLGKGIAPGAFHMQGFGMAAAPQ